jgi:hypothetical protein
MNNSANLPSGPRRHPQPSVRDANHPDFAHSLRIPPSGPSAATSNRNRPPARMTNHTAFTSEEPPHPAMVIDTPQSKVQQPRMSDMATSGMYADREQLQSDQPNHDTVPKGPRALRAPPVTSPIVSRQELSGRGDRSPPFHIVSRDEWDRSRGPSERTQHSGPRHNGHAQRPIGPGDQSTIVQSWPGPGFQASGRNQVCGRTEYRQVGCEPNGPSFHLGSTRCSKQSTSIRFLASTSRRDAASAVRD